jgi:hypothetical protein
MKSPRAAFLSLALIVCLVSSATAQKTIRQSQRRESSQVQSERPAITVISNQPLQNYATRRNGDLFSITIYEVGTFKTISNGQPFEQQQPAGSNDLIISFQLQPRTNPQIEQAGDRLMIYFESISLPESGLTTGALTPPRQPVGGQTRPRVGRPTRPPAQEAFVEPQTVPAVDVTVPIVGMPELKPENYIKPETASGTCDDIAEPERDPISIAVSDRTGTVETRRYPDPKQELVIIDANTGKILEGATRVSENTRIKVVFVNKNPFKYDYSFQLIPKDVGTATVISFLNLIPGTPGIPGVLEGTITAAAQETKNANTAAGEAASLRGTTPAPGAFQSDCALFEADLKIAVANGEKMKNALDASAKTLKTAAENYTAFLKNTNDIAQNLGGREARTNFAKKLCRAGADALPSLQAVVNFDFDKFAKDLNLELLAAQVTTLKNDPRLPKCADQSLYRKVIAALEADVATYKAKLEELKKGIEDSKKKFEGPAKNIKTVLGSSRSFAEVAYAPSLNDATSVSVIVTRKNIRDEVPKDEIIAVSPPLQIGEPRLILSGGLGFSTINERKIVRQQSLVPDGNGGMTLGNRFGFEDRSQFRPSGVVMLNGVLKRFDLFGPKNTSFALSGGLVFSNRNEGLATEFIAGPSLGFANDRLFLTFGFHAARVEELSGGFKIGDPVPADLADPLPVQKNWLNGLIMSLTFRIQP